MGFFDKLGEAAGQAIVKTKNDYIKEKDRIDNNNYSDRQLFNELKNTSNIGRKAAICQELNKRGYGNNNN